VTSTRIEIGIGAVGRAYDQVSAAIDSLMDDAARGASRLPAWTRGHVLTHLARNADGNRNMVEGAIRGEERQQYPGGADQRTDDIEAGAHRDARALVEDFRSSQQALANAWGRVPDDGWSRYGVWLATGRRPIEAGLRARRRELLVHLVDLDLGVRPVDLPEDFVAEQREWLMECRTKGTWPDAPW
jgi:maleylpyruvate isomerase